MSKCNFCTILYNGNKTCHVLERIVSPEICDGGCGWNKNPDQITVTLSREEWSLTWNLAEDQARKLTYECFPHFKARLQSLADKIRSRAGLEDNDD
jgi:hypothetical protein